MKGDIASYKVVVHRINDLYIVYSNLTEVLPGIARKEKTKGKV
jgi:hypothetical protein